MPHLADAQIAVAELPDAQIAVPELSDAQIGVLALRCADRRASSQTIIVRVYTPTHTHTHTTDTLRTHTRATNIILRALKFSFSLI